MTLAYAVAHALPEMRAEAEALMTSTCTITHTGGEPVWDDETGTYVTPEPAVVYAGKCRVRPAATWGRDVEAGEAQAMLSAFRVQIPFAVTGMAAGDLLTVNSSPDPALIGRVLVVRFVPEMGDHLTARRLVCEAA